MLWLDRCLQTLSCNNPDVWKDYLVIYSTKRQKRTFLDTGLRKAWLTWGFWYNVMPMVMYPTPEKKSSQNFSVKRMQRSILSNTVYKTASLPAETEPAVFLRRGAILMVQKSIIAHMEENKTFARHRVLVAFLGSKWQLPHAVLFNFILQMWERCPI